jgi:hypothetical protein
VFVLVVVVFAGVTIGDVVTVGAGGVIVVGAMLFAGCCTGVLNGAPTGISQRCPGFPCSGFIPAAEVVVLVVLPAGVVTGVGFTTGTLVFVGWVFVCDWEAVFSPVESHELAIKAALRRAKKVIFMIDILGTCKLLRNIYKKSRPPGRDSVYG